MTVANAHAHPDANVSTSASAPTTAHLPSAPPHVSVAVAEPPVEVIEHSPATPRLTFRDGLLAGLPIIAGAIPVGVVYAVLCLDAGYSWLQTQMMSLLVYSGAAQLAMVSLREDGAAGLAVIFMAVVLGLRHVLYSMTIRPHLRPGEQPPATALAMFVTDEAYGISTRAWLEGRGSAKYLAGIGVMMYCGWNGGTALGVLFGSLLPDLERLGVEFIFPLLFVVLLLPLLRGRWHLTVAVVGGGLAYLGNQLGFPGGVTIFLAMLGGCAVGALLPREAAPSRDATVTTRAESGGAA